MKAATRPWVEEGFGTLADSFKAVAGSDPGLAFAATRDGRPVADLWYGTIDGSRPWKSDTPALIFSGTKGLVATGILILIDRGALRLEQPVHEVWPEFRAGHKDQVLVAHVLSHTAGLPGLEGRFDLFDHLAMARLLARQTPTVPVGVTSYHAVTFGTLCDELIRRVDGRSAGRFVAEEIAGPLDLDLWIGTPPAVAARTAVPHRREDFKLAAELAPYPDPRLEQVYGSLDGVDWSKSLHCEIPAVNGVATAPALARFYGCLARGGELEGVRLLSDETVKLATREFAGGIDPLSGRLLRFSAGFELTGTPSQLGPVPDAFGFTGSGGSSHGAWPSRQVGFSLVISEMRPETSDDRAHRILGALAACLD